MEKQRAERIAIVGAGVSGLLACKCAAEKGFSPVVFEATSIIGGVWSKTIESTKLQTPKSFYQFSDFPWPSSTKETFPRHDQVLEYLQAYATHFNILPSIKFNSKVVSIDYCGPSYEAMISWDLWGGTGGPFSPSGKWKLTVSEDDGVCREKVKVYEFDFVILCIGKYSDLPNYPDLINLNRGPENFGGKVLHSMDYAAMDDESAAELIEDKLVTVVGFHKSALDIAAEVAKKNGEKHPCTLVFRAAHWTVPESFVSLFSRGFNRFTEMMVHKPEEGFLLCLLVFILTPLMHIFGKLVELYLRLIYPLKKYDVVPGHSFLHQISSCMFMVLPSDFYNLVKKRKLILRKSEVLDFCKEGLIVKGETRPVSSDIVIFATGYKSDEKLINIFSSSYFQKSMASLSSPLYRECIHPRIPSLVILGFADSASVLFTTEMRAKWLSHFLAGKLRFPAIREMENYGLRWEKCMRKYSRGEYNRFCATALLQIHCNDQLCRDIGCNPRRKKGLLPNLFASHRSVDYMNLDS